MHGDLSEPPSGGGTRFFLGMGGDLRCSNFEVMVQSYVYKSSGVPQLSETYHIPLSTQLPYMLQRYLK